ncbi:MAG: DUF115 domain-containing protein [Phycisphaerales bacterium]|nr:DUF115 domain-containing protein [Phycisphaerales bacterium]
MTMPTTEIDRQFILPDDAPYLANLAALWAVDPLLAGKIEAVDDTRCYTTEPSKCGEPTLAMQMDDGRRVYLHSRYHPLDEARKSIEEADFSTSYCYYVHGFALGYLPELVFNSAPPDATICIFEPDLALLKTAFFSRDYSIMIRSRRVLFITQADKAELFNRLGPHIAMLTDGSVTLEHAPSIQLQGSFHQMMKTWTQEFNSYTATNISTLLVNGKRTAENIARNLGWYAATPCISRLKQKHEGMPAIIVSAGPSLRKNKHLLKQAQGRAIIIAVQTTLQPLLEMGIEPHYVTSLDYHDICTRFFEKLPSHLRTHLVVEPKAAPAIFGMYPGPISVLGNDFAERLVKENRLGRACLSAGATVAHLAFYLAEHLGCDPILFVGQDLGFSDGLCYTPGTSYEDVWAPELSRFCTLEMKQWEQIVRDRPILRQVPDYQGRPMYTEQRLFTYLQQFERDFAGSNRTILDCTQGGVYKRGATPMPLAAALDQYCQAAVPEPEQTSAGLRWDRLRDAMESLRLRHHEAREIEEISQQTLPLLEEVRDHLTDQKRVNRAIARIDALRNRMNELGSCYDLITQLAQQSQMQRFKRDRAIDAQGVSGIDKQRQQVQRDIENVRSVASAAGEFQQLMSDCLERLANQSAHHQMKGAA